MKPTSPTTASEKIASKIIRHGVLLEGYKTQEAYQIIGFINREVEPLLVKRLQNFAGSELTRKRQEAILEGARDIIRDGYRQIQSNLTEDLIAQGKVEQGAAVKIIADSLPFKVELVTPSVSVIREAIKAKPIAGYLLPEWLAEKEMATRMAVMGAIRSGFTTGDSIDRIIRTIRGTREKNYGDGILEGSRKQINYLVRTAVAGISDHVRDETFRANADLIKAIQWTATLDTRTCLRCGNLDGQTFPIDKCPTAPLHGHCRCSRTPVLKSWQELGLPLQEAAVGTRASNAVTKAEAKRLRKLPADERREIKAQMQGQVPDSLTYPEWLRRQSAEVQNEALGKTRAQMFRAGQVEIKEFVQDNRRVLTLAELKAALEKSN